MRVSVGRVMAIWFAMMLCAVAQERGVNTGTAAAAAPVPRLIKYSGIAKDGEGKPLNGTVGITFLFYRDEQGGAPLWLETQNVQTDAGGRYSAQLGASQPSGLPPDLFTSGEARWLGAQISGQGEQPRVLLLSVPYALKAGDAETVGGLPASAFMLAAPPAGGTATASSAAAGTTEGVSPATATPVTTTGGAANYLAIFNGTSTIIDSLLYQSGTTVNVNGLLDLPATGTATASGGKTSQAQNFVASSYNSSTAAAVSQTFQWKAEAAGNNTALPSGTLNLLFGSGTTAPAETGLKLTNNGLFTFAPGQTFPGTGTITGVTTASGSGLTGGATKGALSLGLKTCGASQILQYVSGAWTCSNAGTGTITGVTAGNGLTGGGNNGSVTLNLDATKVPQLQTANTFTGNQTVDGNITATRTMSAAAATISGSSGNAVLSVTQSGSGQGIVLSSSSGSPALQISSTGTTAVQATTSATPGFGLVGNTTATSGSSTGVAGNSASNAGVGVVGDAYSTTGNTAGVVGIVASASGVAGSFNNSAGGNILLGSNNGAQRFLVDGGGNITANGKVSASQLVSTVATGTPSFNVASTTQIPNLNASLLGGQPATAFATLGANSFSTSQLIMGSVQVDSAGINGGTGTPGVVFGVGASGETISSDRTNVSGNFQGLDFYTRGLPRISVANKGYVGIATLSPQAPLDVAAEGGIRISLTDSALTNDNNEIYFQDNGEIRSGDDNHRIIFDRSNNNLEMREFGNILFSPGATTGQRTQTVTFASGGFVGIGTTSPSSVLQVAGAQPPAVNSGAGTTAASALGIAGGKGGSTSDGTGQVGGTGGSIGITGGDGGDAPAGSTLGQGGTITLQPGAPGGGGGGCYFGGCGNNYGRVLLAPNGGQVGIGMTPCPYGGGCYELLDVNGTAFFNGDVWANGCVLVGTTGNVIGGTCYSDARFKNDIRPFAPVLDRLVQIRPVSFLWTTDKHPGYHFGTGRSMGVIAQDVEKVFPEMVSTDQNGYKKVNYSELPYLMLEAIRDLKAENDKLRQQVAEVGELRELHLKNQQARLDRLEAELKQLKGRKTEELAASHVSFK